MKLYRQNVSLLFNQTYLNKRLLPKYTYVYIYIYIERERGGEGDRESLLLFFHSLSYETCKCAKSYIEWIDIPLNFSFHVIFLPFCPPFYLRYLFILIWICNYEFSAYMIRFPVLKIIFYNSFLPSPHQLETRSFFFNANGPEDRGTTLLFYLAMDK